MYVIIRNIFLEFFVFTEIIAGVLEDIYKFYLEYKDKYRKYGILIGVFLFFVLIVSNLINAKSLMITSAWLISLLIFVPYLIERIH